VKTGQISFLLAADVKQAVEAAMIAERADLDCTVLKVAHHGSATSTSHEFLAVANPRLAVISVGADNGFGHPNDAVMERLASQLGAQNVYRTDRNGTVEFITNGERLWVRTEAK
jgi:competence protein ComEC